MPADKSGDLPGVDEDLYGDLRVDCYVRSAVPAPLTEPIDDIVERLQRLRDRERLADVRVSAWPPERHAVTETDSEGERTRHDLVAEFERWADERDATLEPAFRRRELSSLPHDIGPDKPCERVRVPVVALALRSGSAGTDAERGTLRGIVPHTASPGTDAERTHTVDEWLSAVERPDRRAVTGTAQTGRGSSGGQR